MNIFSFTLGVAVFLDFSSNLVETIAMLFFLSETSDLIEGIRYKVEAYKFYTTRYYFPPPPR